MFHTLRDPHTLAGDESFAQRTRYKIHSNFYLLTSGLIRRTTMLSALTVLWAVRPSTLEPSYISV